MFIDTHCHVNLIVKKEFDRLLTMQELNEAQSTIESALDNDVKFIINVGTSAIESTNCVSLAQNYASCYAAVGIHPNDCTDEWKQDCLTIAKLAQNKKNNKVIAIGEIGFDRYYEGYNIQRQTDAFRTQVDIALEYDLPLIIHSRNATDETLKAIEEYQKNNIKGIIHCFSDTLPIAQEYYARGFFIGLGGTITYPKNDYLRIVAQQMPLESIVLETDAPYLSPQGLRGKTNYPHNIPLVAQCIATLRNVPLDTVAQQTTENVVALMKIKTTT